MSVAGLAWSSPGRARSAVHAAEDGALVALCGRDITVLVEVAEARVVVERPDVGEVTCPFCAAVLARRATVPG